MKPVYLVIGVPGSGKSWVCRQLTDTFHYVPHDKAWTHPTQKPVPAAEADAEWPKGAKSNHLEVLLRAAKTATKPVITEVPFGERRLRDQLSAAGVKVHPVFVVTDPDTVARRFLHREGKRPQPGTMKRAADMQARAKDWHAFAGTSQEVLDHLNGLVGPKSMYDAAVGGLEKARG